MIAIGRDLIAMKVKLGHGHFGRWVRDEVRISDDAAGRFMKVATTLDTQIPQSAEFDRDAAYALAFASSTVRQRVLGRIKSGELRDSKAIKQAVQEATKTRASPKLFDQAPSEPEKAITPQSPILAAKVEPERTAPAPQAPEPVAPDADTLTVTLTADVRSLEEKLSAATKRIEELEAEKQTAEDQMWDAISKTAILQSTVANLESGSRARNELSPDALLLECGRRFTRAQLALWRSKDGMNLEAIQLVEDWLESGEMNKDFAKASGVLLSAIDEAYKDAIVQIDEGPEPPEDGDDLLTGGPKKRRRPPHHRGRLPRTV